MRSFVNRRLRLALSGAAIAVAFVIRMDVRSGLLPAQGENPHQFISQCQSGIDDGALFRACDASTTDEITCSRKSQWAAGEIAGNGTPYEPAVSEPAKSMKIEQYSRKHDLFVDLHKIIYRLPSDEHASEG